MVRSEQFLWSGPWLITYTTENYSNASGIGILTTVVTELHPGDWLHRENIENVVEMAGGLTDRPRLAILQAQPITRDHYLELKDRYGDTPKQSTS